VKIRFILFLIISILVFGACSSGNKDKEISRYHTKMNQGEMLCFFENFSKYLSSAEDRRLLNLQHAAIKDLPNDWRYDEQYVIVVEKKKIDVDLTTFYVKDAPKLTEVYIAGTREPIDNVVKDINMSCRGLTWEKWEKRRK